MWCREQRNTNEPYWKDLLVLTAILSGLFFLLLGTRPLFVPDEGRYAEIAREMVVNQDYVTPFLNGIKYFEKPVLFYWLGALAIKVGGLNLWSLRSINALIGLLGCLLTYFTTRQLWDRKTGLLAALILGTSSLYFVMAHMVSLDLPVTVFIASSLYAFILGIQSPLGIQRRLWLWSAAAFAALAVLTKGLIGIVFPGIIILTWMAVFNEWRLLKHIYLPSCIVIFLLIATPWHALVAQRNPEFLYFYFIEQHFLRYTDKEIGHYQPVWFFIPTLIVGLFPWSVFLPQTIASAMPGWKNRHQYKNEIFFLIWATFIFLFFSFSKSKLIPYILPMFPPIAILTAHYLKTVMTRSGIGRAAFSISLLVLVVLSFIIAYYLFQFTRTAELPNATQAAWYLNTASLILILGTCLSYFFSYRKPCSATLILICTTGLFLLVSLAALPAIDNRTILPLAKIINSQIKPEDEVVTYDQYYQDLPFYLQRQVSILNWQNELSFGMQHQETWNWMIDDYEFWRRWNSDKRLFVIMDKDNYDQFKNSIPEITHVVLGKTVNNVLISNKN